MVRFDHSGSPAHRIWSIMHSTAFKIFVRLFAPLWEGSPLTHPASRNHHPQMHHIRLPASHIQEEKDVRFFFLHLVCDLEKEPYVCAGFIHLRVGLSCPVLNMFILCELSKSCDVLRDESVIAQVRCLTRGASVCAIPSDTPPINQPSNLEKERTGAATLRSGAK